MQRSRYGRLFFAALAPIVVALIFAGSGALAQDSLGTMFLVAKPGMIDPNFRESVVLVTPDDAGGAIGIIINRPTDVSLASILPEDRFRRFTDHVFFGGPVAPNGIFALFRSAKSPDDAIRVLPDLFLALTPATINELLSRPPSALRLYSGLSAWAPGQVQSEMLQGGWYALDANSQTVFRNDVENIWQELVQRVRSVHAGGSSPTAEPVAFGPIKGRDPVSQSVGATDRLVRQKLNLFQEEGCVTPSHWRC